MRKRHGLVLPVTAVVAGVVVALVLVGLTIIFPAPSTTNLTWSGPIGSNAVFPRGVLSGGPIGATNCTMLHVRFDASGPIYLWVAPGGADGYFNQTVWFTQYWTSVGPAMIGEFAVHVPQSSTGYRVVMFNPSWTSTLSSMQFETAEGSC